MERVCTGCKTKNPDVIIDTDNLTRWCAACGGRVVEQKNQIILEQSK
jgi:rRNA maturation endonuclease Nob1